ncbi:hypothetical protein GEV33_013333 [Tenebrio molitor]|uniref:Uncharacterized protein n=1 Tax=Tenebrio molitor TaxID=7067 RepID=A0A8J6H7H1_TENMO|nr:hypothetical protein GEV33_013333 [Tenebrio molitor]
MRPLSLLGLNLKVRSGLRLDGSGKYGFIAHIYGGWHTSCPLDGSRLLTTVRQPTREISALSNDHNTITVTVPTYHVTSDSQLFQRSYGKLTQHTPHDHVEKNAAAEPGFEPECSTLRSDTLTTKLSNRTVHCYPKQCQSNFDCMDLVRVGSSTSRARRQFGVVNAPSPLTILRFFLPTVRREAIEFESESHDSASAENAVAVVVILFVVRHDSPMDASTTKGLLAWCQFNIPDENVRHVHAPRVNNLRNANDRERIWPPSPKSTGIP